MDDKGMTGLSDRGFIKKKKHPAQDMKNQLTQLLGILMSLVPDSCLNGTPTAD